MQVQLQMRINQMQMQVQMHPSHGNQMQVQVHLSTSLAMYGDIHVALFWELDTPHPVLTPPPRKANIIGPYTFVMLICAEPYIPPPHIAYAMYILI